MHQDCGMHKHVAFFAAHELEDNIMGMSASQPMPIRFLLRWFPRLLVLCGVLTFGAYIFQAYTFPTDDVRGGLRGNTLLIMRLPTRDAALEQIWINENGTATRG